MHHCMKFILFWNDTVHVSDGLSVHHQQLKTVHTTTGMCQTDTAVCLLVGTRWNWYPLASRQQYLFGCCMYNFELLKMDGKTVRNMYSVTPKNKFDSLVHLVCFTIEIYHDARSHVRQISFNAY